MKKKKKITLLIVGIIVLTFLILGGILFRNVLYCGNICLGECSPDKVIEKTRLGGISQPRLLTSGGERKIVLFIKNKEQGEYNVSIENINVEKENKISNEEVESWIVEKGFQGNIKNVETIENLYEENLFKENETAKILEIMTLDIPQNKRVGGTTILIQAKVKNLENGNVITKQGFIRIEYMSRFKKFIC